MDESRQNSGDVRRESDSTHSSYWSEIHVEMVALLVVVFLILLAVGWSLRPSSTGYPSVPHGLALEVSGDELSSINVNLTRNHDNSAMLTVSGVSAYKGKPISYVVSSPGRVHPCQPRHGDIVDTEFPAHTGTGVPWPRISVTSSNRSKMDLQSNSWALFLRLCWSSNAPVSLDGPYLSASVPSITVNSNGPNPSQSPPPTSVQIVMVPNAGDTSSYSLQATPSPSQAAGNSWTWSESASVTYFQGEPTTVGNATVGGSVAIDIKPSPPIYVAAVNAGRTQQDTLRAFFAGVLLGIAGGALIAILQELISPLSRRRDARHPV